MSAKRKAAPELVPAAPLPAAPTLWISLALAVITPLIYWPATHCQFVNYDDTDFVTANPHVQAGLTAAGFKWAWHSEVARNWHPITVLTHMVDCQLFGLNAGRHHLDNVLLHVANAVLLFHLLKYMTGAVWRSAFVAALFALHPLHVESVAWIAERKDVLSTFFWFGSIWTYASYARGRKSMYAVSLLLFAFGLMSKPMLVTGPFLLLLLDYWPLQRTKPFRAALIWEKAPFLLMSTALCVITYLIQWRGGAMLTGQNLSLASRLQNAPISYMRYIGKMFWPRGLSALYLRHGAWPIWAVAGSVLALIVVSIIVIKQARVRPWLPVGWFWYLGTLAPVIGVVQVGMQTMADRFSYMPLVGLFLIISWGVAELAARRRLPASAPATAAAFVLAVCAVLTVRQISYWQDSETLFNRMIAMDADNYMAHYNLGNFYAREQRSTEALANYQAALEEEPNYADAHNNLGNLLLEQKRYDEAIAHYADAVRVNPQPIYYLNYANALADAASARHDANQFASAVRAYGQAIAVDPTSSEPHHNLGLTWEAQGKEDEAVAEFREAVRLRPDLEQLHLDLAAALARLNRNDDAITEYLAAAQLDPNRADTHNCLALCYVTQNKMADAAREFQEVVRLQPDNAAAEGNLGNAFAAQNRIDEAVSHYQAALRLNPRDFQTEFNLGLTLAGQGKRAEAAEHYQRALSIKPGYLQAQQALQQLQTGAVNQNQK